MNTILLVVVGSIAGSIGARLGRRKIGGWLTSIALGMIGALLGSWLAERFDLGTGPTFNDFPVIWAVIGAALFVAVLNLVPPATRQR